MQMNTSHVSQRDMTGNPHEVCQVLVPNEAGQEMRPRCVRRLWCLVWDNPKRSLRFYKHNTPTVGRDFGGRRGGYVPVG